MNFHTRDDIEEIRRTTYLTHSLTHCPLEREKCEGPARLFPFFLSFFLSFLPLFFRWRLGE